MHDVFISYSSEDVSEVEKVCEYLEKSGIRCWMSYRYNDLAPGKTYTQSIISAIDNSKVFAILLSKNSIDSQQVIQELVAANERQRFGLKIFPIILKNDYEYNDFRSNMGYVLAGKEMFDWSNATARNELLKEINNYLNPGSVDKKTLLTSHIPEIGTVVGREHEMEILSARLGNQKRLWVKGTGGIGKTYLLIAFCRQALKSYKTVIYISVENCLIRTFDKDNGIIPDSSGIFGKRESMTNYEYAFYKFNLLENSVDGSTLLVIDNVENNKDPLFERICKFRCDLIIGSRYDKIVQDFEEITITEIKERADLYSLFEINYGKKMNEEEKKSLDSILYGVRYHTLSIVLMAKQMSYFEKSPCDYRDKIEISLERSNNFSHICFDEDIKRTYSHLFEMFESINLTEQETTVMKTLSILPVEGIYRHTFQSLLGNDYYDEMIRLEKMGWIQNDKDNKYIFLHPLIRDVVYNKFNLYLNDPGLSIFVSNFFAEISNCWDKSYDENIRYKDLALSIYFIFPEPTIIHYKDYLKLAKLLWVLNFVDISLEIQDKIRRLFINENGYHAFSSEEAEAMLQVGLTYQTAGDFDHAEAALEQSVRIFGNRYAAALSHLAQAKMSVNKQSIAEIEPLLKESLEIRNLFWKDTISEGAAYHLYAKVLSSYDHDLGYAIEMEKKAYQIFSKLQPGGVNVSSSAYILGWLFVQTAEDDEDLQYGISKLEEAKHIRINFRGDPLHPWMDDIYLKLGKSYELVEDYVKAIENYEALLKVRLRKYKNDYTNTYVVEVYKSLLVIYQKLGDAEGIKNCKKYLKYYF